MAAGCICKYLGNDNTSCSNSDGGPCLAAGTAAGGFVVWTQSAPTQFGLPPAGPNVEPVETAYSPARSTRTVTRTQERFLGQWRAAHGLGGWSISSHHAYDPNSRSLIYGNGSISRLAHVPSAVRSIAGGGAGAYIEGVPAADANLPEITSLIAHTDGSVYLASDGGVHKFGQDGLIHAVAGAGTQSVDGYHPLQTIFTGVRAIAISATNRMYVGTSGAIRSFDINDPNAKVNTIAGATNTSAIGDNGPATAADLSDIYDLVFGPDGALYLADNGTNRVRRIDARGIITTIAGNGQNTFWPANPTDASSAPDAQSVPLLGPTAIAFDSAGDLYIGTVGGRIYRVKPTGRIEQLPLWKPGTNTSFQPIQALATDGRRAVIYSGGFNTDYKGLVLGRDPHQSLVAATQRVAGNDGAGMTLDGQFATLNGGFPAGLWLHNSTSLYAVSAESLFLAAVVDQPPGAPPLGSRILHIGPPLQGWKPGPIAIPSQDGALLHEFDQAGRHLKTKDARTGIVLADFKYHPDGQLKEIWDSLGRITAINRTGNIVAEIVSPFGNKTKLGVFGETLRKVVDPSGGITRFEYASGEDQEGLLTSMSDPIGNVTKFTWTDKGLLLRDTGAAGDWKELARSSDPQNRTTTTTVTTKLGHQRFYTVNKGKVGETTRERVSLGSLQSGAKAIEKTFATPARLNAAGQLAGSPDGHLAHQFDLQPNGLATWRLWGSHPSAGAQTPVVAEVRTRTESGLAQTRTRTDETVSSSGPEVRTTRRWTELVPGDESATSAFLWETVHTKQAPPSQDWVVTETSPMGRTTSTRFDGLGRPVESWGPGQPTATIAYHLAGPSVGLPASVALEAGGKTRTTTYGYTNGALTSVATAGVQVAFTNDAAGRVTRQTLADGRVVDIGRDAAGRLTSLKPPAPAAAAAAPTYGFSYTPAGNVATETIPPVAPHASWPTTFAYDSEKVLSKITRVDGSAYEFVRDGLGRLATIRVPNTAAALPMHVTYTVDYDLSVKERIAKLSRGANAALEFAWDSALPTKERWTGSELQPAQDWRVTRGYDALLRQTTLGLEKVAGTTATVQSVARMDFDKDGLVVGARVTGATDQPPYFGAEKLTRNGQTGLVQTIAQGVVTIIQQPNPFLEPATYTVQVTGQPQPLYQETYLRDNLGRIQQREVRENGTLVDTFLYVYHAHRGWLTSVTRNGGPPATWTYDDRGNRISATPSDGTTVTSTYDAQDRLLSQGAVTFGYDVHGRIVSKTAPGETTAYTWDAAGRLVKVLRTPTTGAPTVVEYVLDPAGRRVGKKKGTGPGDMAMVAGWVYDGALMPAAELDGSGKVVARFVYGSRSQTPDFAIAVNADSGAVTGTYQFLHDNVGSVVSALRTSDGYVVEKCSFDAWGVRTANLTSGALQHPFGFAGGIWDPDTSLVRFGDREYLPEIGRWMATDPVGFAGGSTLLSSYANSDPVNLIDPDGLKVVALFNKCTNRFVSFDLDTGEITSTNAESGGKPTGDPIPDGFYDILRHPSRDRFRLDCKDGTRDDVHNASGRGLFRLHGKGRTTGCIAASGSDADWDRTRRSIQKTKPEKVVSTDQGYAPGPIHQNPSVWRFFRAVTPSKEPFASDLLGTLFVFSDCTCR